MNKKDERVRKLWARGIRDPKVLARKLGYDGAALAAGIERVKDAIRRLGLR